MDPDRPHKKRSRSAPHDRQANGDYGERGHRKDRGHRSSKDRGSSSRARGLREEDLFEHDMSGIPHQHSPQMLANEPAYRADAYGSMGHRSGRHSNDKALALMDVATNFEMGASNFSNFIEENMTRGVEADKEAIAEAYQWLEEADNGELDIYTCLALSDITSWNSDSKDLLSNIFCTLVIQALVPLLLLGEGFEALSEGGKEKDLEFRVGGFILFLYSLWQLYNGSQDNCRMLMIDRGFAYHVPLRYILPAAAGDLMNALVGLCLVVSLYVIFSGGRTIAELVMNAVAVNFLASIDTEFTSPKHIKNAKANFEKVFPKNSKKQRKTIVRRVVHVLLIGLLALLRYGGICLMGTVMALAFLFGHEPLVCDKPEIAKYMNYLDLCQEGDL